MRAVGTSTPLRSRKERRAEGLFVFIGCNDLPHEFAPDDVPGIEPAHEDLLDLSSRDAMALCAAASAMLGSTCWRNSPQARAAIAAAIEAARAARRPTGA